VNENYTKWLKLSQLAKRQRIKEQGLKVLKIPKNS